MREYADVSIWVDDVRPKPEDYDIWTRSVNETITIIEVIEKNNGTIELIDLDHDLGEYAYDGGDAIRILDYLVEHEKFYRITFHTANPVGMANMERIIKRFWP